MRFTLLIFLAILLANTALADDRHKRKHHAVVIEKAPVVNNYYSSTNYEGVASAISAAQCHFDGGSFDLQLCGGYGHIDNQDAFTFGAGQKVGDFLLNITVTDENGLISRGGGINWKVKFK